MINTNINIEDIYKKTAISPETLDQLHLEKLEHMKSSQQAKNMVYDKEKVRLTAKYGANHPRVKKMDAKLNFREGFMKSLDFVIDSASIKIPAFDENTWMIYGRVLNKDLKGIKSLTVSFYDKRGKWIEEFGYACTDKRGFYSLVSPPGVMQHQQSIPESRELFLTVTDKQNQILFRETEPRFAEIGQVDSKLIRITGREGACTPPESGHTTCPPPAKEEWVVEGIVEDGKNKPLQGVEVRLSDEKGFFDKRVTKGISGKDGKFKFVFRDKDFQELDNADVDIYVKAFDGSGKEVYTSTYAVTCCAGGVAEFILQLPGMKKKK